MKQHAVELCPGGANSSSNCGGKSSTGVWNTLINFLQLTGCNCSTSIPALNQHTLHSGAASGVDEATLGYFKVTARDLE